MNMLLTYPICPHFIGENGHDNSSGKSQSAFITKGKKRFLKHCTCCMQNRSDLKGQEMKTV